MLRQNGVRPQGVEVDVGVQVGVYEQRLLRVGGRMLVLQTARDVLIVHFDVVAVSGGVEEWGGD